MKEVFDRWFAQGWVAGIFENRALDSADAGERIAIPFGPEILAAERATTRAPDMPHRIGWKYLLVAKAQTTEEALRHMDPEWSETSTPADEQLQEAYRRARKVHTGPLVGDFVLDGERVCRIAYVHQHEYGFFQLTEGGSFSLHGARSECAWDPEHGIASYSGGLEPGISLRRLSLVPDDTRPGRFWHFHRGIPQARSGVDFELPCQVWRLNDPQDPNHV